MKALLLTAFAQVTERCNNAAAGWNRFWFSPTDPTTLAAIRISTGLVLLYTHLGAAGQALAFLGPHAWIDPAALAQISALGQTGSDPLDRWVNGWWGQSIWFYLEHPGMVWAAYALFLTALVCFTLGFWSRTAALIAWIGHLSYLHRGFITWDGMDSQLAMLLLYLMFGPIGATLSIDRSRKNLPRSGPEPSWSANVIIRMIQVHMGIIYLCAGLAKLQGARWWDGTAVWMSMVLPEYVVLDLSWLAQGGDWLCLLVSNLGVAMTLIFEISFIFLIWNPTLRPWILLMGVFMHVGIGLIIGLESFGAAMLTGCLAFVAPSAVHRVVEWLCRTCRANQQLPTSSRKTARAA